MQVDRWKAKLWCQALCVEFFLIKKFHFKNWARDAYHELWHRKNLFARVLWRGEGLSVDFLCYSVKMSEDDSTLRKGKNAVEDSLSFHNVC